MFLHAAVDKAIIECLYFGTSNKKNSKYGEKMKMTRLRTCLFHSRIDLPALCRRVQLNDILIDFVESSNVHKGPSISSNATQSREPFT